MIRVRDNVAINTLVGRRDEVAVVDRMLAALDEDRRGGVLVIAGEAGVGKSRLVDALTEMAAERPVSVLVGRCIQFGESALPLSPVVDILGELDAQLSDTELERVLGPAGGELAGLRHPGLGSGTRATGLEARQLVELIHGVIARLAQSTPLVLVIEDLHWADGTTRDLVGYLALALRRNPVLLVLTYRSDDLHRRHPLLPALAELQRAARPERIELEPFDADTTTDFVRSLTGDEPSNDAVAQLLRRSGGNPFYLEELLVGAELEAPLPLTLREVVLSRSIDLDEDTLNLLRVASVAGANVDVELLGEVTGFDKKTMNSALHHLVDAHFLVENEGRFAFRHELTREVFTDELLSSERAELHEAIAETLEANHPDRVGEIAHHWYESGHQAEALRTAILAGEAADRTGATAAALVHYERAIELWERVPEPTRTVAIGHAILLMTAAIAADLLEDFSRAVELGRRSCTELADGDPLTYAIALCQHSKLLWNSGTPGLQETVDEALALVESEPDSGGVAQVLARAAGLDMMANRYSQAIMRGTRAMAMAEVAGDDATVSNCLNTVGLSQYFSGDPGGIALMRQSLELALEMDDAHEVNRGHINLSEVLFAEGATEEALAIALDGLSHSEASGFSHSCGIMLVEDASRCLELFGRWDELDTLTDTALSRRRLDLDVLAPTGLSIAARVMVKRGETDTARPILEHDLKAEMSDYYCGHADVLISGLLELNLIEHQTGSDHQPLLTIIGYLERNGRWLHLLELLSVALRCEATEAVEAGYLSDEGRVAAHRAAADRWIESAESAASQVRVDRTQIEAQVILEQCRAEHSRAHGRNDTGEWAAVVTGWAGLERPWPTAYAKWRYAEALLLADSREATHRETATEQLRAAYVIVADLRAKPLLADIEDLATRARIDLGSPAVDQPEPEPEPVPFDLTPREVEVLSLVAEGYSNGRIGKELFISTKTASVHVSNILRKLNAANRVEAAAIAAKAVGAQYSAVVVDQGFRDPS
jgi:DNA-binding CsgD family transcriptional regulator